MIRAPTMMDELFSLRPFKVCGPVEFSDFKTCDGCGIDFNRLLLIEAIESKEQRYICLNNCCGEAIFGEREWSHIIMNLVSFTGIDTFDRYLPATEIEEYPHHVQLKTAEKIIANSDREMINPIILSIVSQYHDKGFVSHKQLKLIRSFLKEYRAYLGFDP